MAMMRPRRRSRAKADPEAAQPDEIAISPENAVDTPSDSDPAIDAATEANAAPVVSEPEGSITEPAIEAAPEPPASAPEPAPTPARAAPGRGSRQGGARAQRRRFVINLNMLSNVDVKFYTEGENRADVIARWKSAIGVAKRERPEETVEVVMGAGDAATSYILYLAEVTAFAVGAAVDDSDAINWTVNV